jgi:hypothetical protein
MIAAVIVITAAIWGAVHGIHQAARLPPRREIAYILLGKLGLLTLAAIPPGWLFGYGLCTLLAWSWIASTWLKF